MTTRSHLEAVVRWLNDLAGLYPPMDDTKPRIASLAGFLADDFPPEAFSRESIKAVARQCKFFPSYAEVCDALGPWWREHRPLPPLLEAPPPEPLSQRTPDELQHVSRVVAGITGELDEYNAKMRLKPNNTLPISRQEMTRAELTEAYRRAGLKGPQLPTPLFLIVPAHNDA